MGAFLLGFRRLCFMTLAHRTFPWGRLQRELIEQIYSESVARSRPPRCRRYMSHAPLAQICQPSRNVGPDGIQ